MSSNASATSGDTASQAQATTVQRNERVFRNFQKSFQNLNELEKIKENATKFTKWLENPKGYYDAARLQIVRLAMTLHKTLREATGAPPTVGSPFPLEAHMHHELSPYYVALVKTIHKFRHLFTEPGDPQMFLRILFNSVNLPSEDAQPAGAVQVPAMTLTPQQSIVHPQHTPNTGTQVTQPAPSDVPSPQVMSSQSATAQPYAHTQGQGPAPISGIPTSVSSAGQTTRPTLQDVFSNPSRTVTADQVGFSVKPPTSSVTETVSLQKKKKRKKKTSLDISLYEDLDVQTFLAKKEQVHSPTLSVPPVASFSGNLATVAQQGETEARESGPTRVIGGEPTMEIIVSDRPSQQAAPVVVKREPEEIILLPTHTHREVIDLTLSDDEDDRMVVDQVLPRVPTVESSVSMELDVPLSVAQLVRDSPLGNDHLSGPSSGMEEGTVESPTEEQGKGSGEVEMEMDLESGNSRLTMAEVHIHPSAMRRDVDTMRQGPELADSRSTLEAMSDADVAINNPSGTPTGYEGRGKGHASVNVEEQEPIPVNPQPHIHPQAMVEANTQLPPALDAEQAQEGSVSVILGLHSQGGHESKVQDPADMDIEQEPVESVPTPLPYTTKTHSENDMHIVASAQGQSGRARLKFELNVDEEQYKSIAIWAHQSAPILELKGSLCVSLACYPSAQVDLSEPLEAQLKSLNSSWPEGGGLTLNVEFRSNVEKLSLSPPLFASPESIVDLSMFIKGGLNEFFIDQKRDFSEYTFVLCCHQPTAAQVEVVERKRRQEDEWRNWLKDMAKPIKIVLPPLQAAVPASA